MSGIALEFTKHFSWAKDTECIDSWIFKLMNKLTPGMLTIASIIVSARQFFGEPIRCDAGAVRHLNLLLLLLIASKNNRLTN